AQTASESLCPFRHISRGVSRICLDISVSIHFTTQLQVPITPIPEGDIMDCTDIAIIEQPPLPGELAATLELAAALARASKAKATQEAYGSDFRIFESWCQARGLSALPATAESLCAFLADEATLGKRASTLGRRLAAIRYFHRAAGYETPT